MAKRGLNFSKMDLAELLQLRDEIETALDGKIAMERQELQSKMAELAAFMHALSVHPKYLTVEDFFVNGFQVGKDVRLQPRMSVSGFIRLAKAS